MVTGSLQQKSGRPNYFAVLNYYINDKRKQKWINTDIPVKGSNKRRAEARLVEILAEYNEQNLVLLDKEVFFVEYLKEWLENLKPSIELVTYDTYRLIVYNQIIPFFEGKKLRVKDITGSHIQKYVNFKLQTVSPNTVRKHLFNLSKCFDRAVKDNIIGYNPVKRIDMPKKIKYIGAKYYSEAQIQDLLNVTKGDVLEVIILFALFYALRRSEIIGIKWGAIDFQRNLISIQHTVVRVDKTLYKKDSTKNKSSNRVFPLPDIIKKPLLEIKEQQAKYKLIQPNDYIDEDYVFANVDGQVINPNYVTKHFKDLLTKNNLPCIRFHDLRHSAASYLLSLGFDLKEIQFWLGHGEISTTMNIYAHLDMTAKENIANTLNGKFENFHIARDSI